MNFLTLRVSSILLALSSIASAQKLEIVESDLVPLDTAKAVSVEFYYGGITINNYPNEELFLRANKGQEIITNSYLSARDSLNTHAFLLGYASQADTSLPELQSDNKQVSMHLIIKTVHWQTSFDNSHPDHVVLEYILVANPGRRLQHGRYYMRKVVGGGTKDRVENMTSAYYKAGQTFAKALKAFSPEN